MPMPGLLKRDQQRSRFPSFAAVVISWMFCPAPLGAIVFCGVMAGVCVAQQVPTDPTSTHIFPAGGRRGTTVDVRVGGECLPPGTRFRVFGQGVSVPTELGEPATGRYAPSPRRKPGEQPMNYPREWQSQLKIADDALTGVRLWRLSCARGGTGGRPFIVGDLPEFIESEPNSLFSQAEKVELPITINGQIAGESDLDYFRFEAQAGEIVCVDVVSARLGSTLDPVIQVLNGDGQRVRGDDLRNGADPVFAFCAETTGEYLLLISNVTFKGGPSYVYRATISTVPSIQFVFPPGGQAGTQSDIAFFAMSGKGSLQKRIQSIDFPTEVGEFWYRGPLGVNAVPLRVDGLPEAIESQENDSRETASELRWPVILNGQFEADGDEDWFRLNGQKGQPMTIECEPCPRWSAALPQVSLLGSRGDVLASSSTVQAANGKIRIEWQPPEDGAFWIRLKDQGVHGGPGYIYRLRVQEAIPDFLMTIKSDVINVVQGAKAEVDVVVQRRGGCVAPIELMIEGLPDGVRIEGNQIAPNQTSTKLSFIAQDQARSGDHTLRIRGRAEIQGAMFERVAMATHLGHDVDGVGIGASEIDHVQLNVVHKPVFRLYCNEAYQYAHRGTIYPYLMEVERLNGFDGPIHLQVADRQIKDLDGIEIPGTTVEPGQSRVMLPIYLPETMHINVQAHSNVYAQGFVEFQDSFGQKQTMLVVSTMRCMIRTLPTVARLRSIERELTVHKGHPLRCSLIVDRTSLFSGPLKVELVDAAPGIHADPVLIPADRSETEIMVDFDSLETAGQQSNLVFRAVGEMAGDVKLVTETHVPIKIVSSVCHE